MGILARCISQAQGIICLVGGSGAWPGAMLCCFCQLERTAKGSRLLPSAAATEDLMSGQLAAGICVCSQDGSSVDTAAALRPADQLSVPSVPRGSEQRSLGEANYFLAHLSLLPHPTHFLLPSYLFSFRLGGTAPARFSPLRLECVQGPLPPPSLGVGSLSCASFHLRRGPRVDWATR